MEGSGQETSVSGSWVRVLGLVVLCTSVLLGCQSEAPNVAVTMDVLTENPTEYYGEEVVVSGEVDQAYGLFAFTIGGSGFGEEVPVVVPDEANVTGGRSGDVPYRAEDVVQVEGTVRQYAVAEIEQEYGLDLGEVDIEEGGPALIAETVNVSPREVTEEPITDLQAIEAAEEPARLERRAAQLIDVPVSQVLSDSTFWVGRERGLFVVLDEELTPADQTEGRYNVNQGDTLSLTGVLLPVPEVEAIEDRWEFDDQTVEALLEEDVYLRAGIVLPENSP